MFFNQNEKETDYLNPYFYAAFLIFSLDILINFNTAYIHKDTIIKERKLIAR